MNVIVTGSGSGLGQEIFARFTNEGHHVVGSAFGNDVVNSTETWVDFGDPAQVSSYAANVARRCNHRVDVLVNCAGINGIRKFADVDDRFIAQMMQVNCFAPVMLTQWLLKSGALVHGAVVCNIISDAAWRPMRHSLAYNMSKAAFDMATKQMARELSKPYGISVFGFRPGKLAGTGMSRYIDEQVCAMRDWTPEQAMKYFRDNSVTGLETWPSHVADLVYRITTSPLARNLSGSCLDLVG